MMNYKMMQQNTQMSKTVGNQLSFDNTNGGNYNVNSMKAYNQGLHQEKQNTNQSSMNYANTFKHQNTSFNRNSLLVNEPNYTLNSAKTSNAVDSNSGPNFFKINSSGQSSVPNQNI
jgi:hypothetical protein